MIHQTETHIIAAILPTGPRMKLSPREVLAALSGGATLRDCLEAEEGSVPAQRRVSAAIREWQFQGVEKSSTPTVIM